MHFQLRKAYIQRTPRGTTRVHLTCTLSSSRRNRKFLLFLTIRPRFVGLNRPTPRRHFAYNSCPQLCIWQSWRPLRSSSGDCGARAGGTGSAGCAGRRRIVAALGRGSLLWAPTKRGREHQMRTTRRDPVPRYAYRRNSLSSTRKFRFLTPFAQAAHHA
jgi:hypothetical protein